MKQKSPEGIYISKPKAGAPDFVKAKVAIQLDKYTAWAATQKEHLSEKGWLWFQVKEGRNGEYYIALDTYKPEPRKTVETPAPTEPTVAPENDNGIPF